MKRLVTLLVFILCGSGLLSAQTIQLKDGGHLKGTILNDISSNWVQLELSTGDTLLVPQNSIAYIQKDKIKKQLPFYGWLGIQTMVGNTYEPFEEDAWGLGIIGAGGYELTHWLKVGLGASIQLYEDKFAPVFGEIRGQILDNTRVSPRYSLAVGHGFFLDANDSNTADIQQGGLYYNPSVGLVFQNASTNWFLDVGYQAQYHKLKYDNIWSWQWIDPVIEDKRIYQRWCFRVGMEF